MFKERQEKKEEVEGRQHGETKTTTHGRRGENKTTLYWNADTKKWQRQFIRKKPPTGEEQDARLREESNKVKREKIEKQRESGDIFPDLRGGEGDIPASIRLQKELEQREAFEDESGANEWGPKGQLTASEQIAFQGDDGDQASIENENATVKDIERQIAIANNEKYLKSVSWDGINRTYTTNFRDAVKNAAGWSAYYDEPDELGNPIAKSDVFTRGEDGQPLGVMGRSQRRAYDMKMHEAKMATKAQMEDSGRSESDVKAINSKEGLETVIDGGESAKTDVAKGSQPNIIEPPEKKEIKLPGGR